MVNSELDYYVIVVVRIFFPQKDGIGIPQKDQINPSGDNSSHWNHSSFSYYSWKWESDMFLETKLITLEAVISTSMVVGRVYHSGGGR